MLKIVCAVFLLFFVFSAGTIVGSHFKNQIESQKTSIAQSIRKSLEDTAEGQSTDSAPTEITQEVKSETKVEKQEVVKSLPKKKNKTVKKTTRKAKPKPKPTVKSKTLAGKYTVQLASFPSKALADEMASKLKRQNYNAIVFTGSYKGQTWYRVGIGSYATIGEANKKQRQLVLDKVARGSIISKIR